MSSPCKVRNYMYLYDQVIQGLKILYHRVTQGLKLFVTRSDARFESFCITARFNWNFLYHRVTQGLQHFVHCMLKETQYMYLTNNIWPLSPHTTWHYSHYLLKPPWCVCLVSYERRRRGKELRILCCLFWWDKYLFYSWCREGTWGNRRDR